MEPHSQQIAKPYRYNEGAHGDLLALVMLLLGFGSASIKTSNIKPNSNSKKLLLHDCHLLSIR